MELILNANVKTKRKFLLKKCLQKFKQYCLHFFTSVQNKNSITGKHAIFAIRRKKTRRKNLGLLEKMNYWLSSSIALWGEVISGSWHEEHFFLMCWHSEEYILAQHCSWSAFSVLQKEIQISEDVLFPDG